MEKIIRILLVLFIIFLIAGCKGEDGEDGKVYAEGEWTPDVTHIDMSDLIKGGVNPSYFREGKRYELEPGRFGYLYWKSNNTWYYHPVTVVDIEKGEEGSVESGLFPDHGKDGKDAIMRYKLSGSTITDLGTVYE